LLLSVKKKEREKKMMKKPRVSVCIPMYNAVKFLPETLTSVFEQTVKPFEIVMINDCSTDASLSLAEELLSTTEIPSHIHSNAVNLGIGGTRQAFYTHTLGDYLAYLSSDDVWHPTFLEKSMPHLDRICATFSDYYHWNYMKKEKAIFYAPKCKNYFYDFQAEVVSWALRKNMFVNFSTIIIPKWWFQHISFESELRHGEDLIFLLDTMIKGYRWEHIDSPLLDYRLHPAQGTRQIQRDKAYFDLLWKHLEDRLVKLDIAGDVIKKSHERSYKISFPSFLDRVKGKVRRVIG